MPENFKYSVFLRKQGNGEAKVDRLCRNIVEVHESLAALKGDLIGRHNFTHKTNLDAFTDAEVSAHGASGLIYGSFPTTTPSLWLGARRLSAAERMDIHDSYDLAWTPSGVGIGSDYSEQSVKTFLKGTDPTTVLVHHVQYTKTAEPFYWMTGHKWLAAHNLERTS